MIFTELFPDKQNDSSSTSISLEVDKYTDNYGSENIKSTMYAHQPSTCSTLKYTKNIERYITSKIEILSILYNGPCILGHLDDISVNVYT